MKNLVILGAGTAGTTTANQLLKKLPSSWNVIERKSKRGFWKLMKKRSILKNSANALPGKSKSNGQRFAALTSMLTKSADSKRRSNRCKCGGNPAIPAGLLRRPFRQPALASLQTGT